MGTTQVAISSVRSRRLPMNAVAIPAMPNRIDLSLPGRDVPRVRPAWGFIARCPDDRHTEAGARKPMPRDSTTATYRSRSGR